MAIDPEEFKKRREQRKKKKTKRTVLLLAIAAAVLLLCGLLIWFLATKDKKPAGDPSLAPNRTVIHLAAAGDLNVTETVVASGGTNYDYTATFMDVLPLLSQADLTALNFEGNLYGEPYGTDRSAPQSLMTALERCGVDILQLANSYPIYHGMDGLSKTIDGIRLAGMEPLGAYATQQEAKANKGFSIRTVQGVKIALVAFTKGMDGMALPAGNEGCVNVLYRDYSTDYQEVDTSGINAILSAIQKEKPDLTVAFLHWGSEFNDTISSSQEKVCQLMQDGGVDVILGTHSHYVQKMTLDPNTGNFVAWSLGDFISDADRAGSEYSVVLDLEITKDNDTGNTRVTGFSYTPIFTINEEGKPLRVVRIHEAIAAYDLGYMDKVSEATYNAMKYALDRIEVRIHGPKEKPKS